MTGTKSKNGVLTYNIHNELKDDIKTVRTDGQYSNVAWDNVDIERKYRFAVPLSPYVQEKWVELLFDLE